MPPVPSAPGIADPQFLEQTWQDRLERARNESLPEQADQILSHGLPLLVHCLGRSWTPSDHTLRDVELVLEGAGGLVGVSLCNQPSKTRGLPDKLRRLRDQLKEGRPSRLVLLRDARLPIGSGAKKTREYLDDLATLGARIVRPSAEAMAALQALRTLLSDAKAGDLSNNGRPLDPTTVQEWLAAHMPRDLCELVEEVASNELPSVADAPDALLIDALLELLEERHVVALPEAAAHLGRPIESLADSVRRHSEQFGILNGSPMVVFQLTSEGVSD
jgi:hypothetical protein